jgi:hypothetical protein
MEHKTLNSEIPSDLEWSAMSRQFRHGSLRAGLLLAVCLLSAAPSSAQSPSSESLLDPWGGPDVFPNLYRESVDAFFAAEAAYRNAAYGQASTILREFWKAHPPGTREWASAAGDAQWVGRVTGANFGTPACYSALRMLTDCAEWRLRLPPGDRAASHVIRLTVVLVGQSSGKQPPSMEELRTGGGPVARHKLDRRLAQGNYEAIDQSLYLFREYIRAITGGRLSVEVKVLPLPDLEVPVEIVERRLAVASGARDLIFANMAQPAQAAIWHAVDRDALAGTDWWWVLYPSHVPRAGASYPRGTIFTTGGMGRGPDGSSPAFLIDDLWLLRVPSQLGSGPYTEAERRAYLPQWFQHEFFHHLFRTYPELKLEETGHQWFDRSAWPNDFEGRLEADYYTEAVHKRLQSATPPLDIALRYAPSAR